MSRELGELAGFAQYPYRWRVATALLRQIDGESAGALELLDEAERVYDTDFSPEVRRVVGGAGSGPGGARGGSPTPSPGQGPGSSRPTMS